MVVLRRHDQLGLDTYFRVVDGDEDVTLDPALLRHVATRREAMERHLAGGATAYGVTTGLGYFADRAVPPSDQLDLQRAILVGRAVGLGPPLPEPVVRGAMLLRLVGFASGTSGVSAELCCYLADRLAGRWYPVVPASRPGTAGETIPLCHLFETFIGEGEVLVDGERMPAAQALAASGTEPYELKVKEGLALVNGAPLAPAFAAEAWRRASGLVDVATTIGTAVAWLVDASWRPYSRRIAALKRDPGQQRVHDQLADLVAGADDAPRDDATQAPVSLRVLPQVHGAVLDVLDSLRRQVERELTAVTDSPLYLDESEPEGEQEGFYPSGNFHSQALSLALDVAAIAMAQVGALCEKRLHRLLDHRFSGLPDQLAADSARGGSGLVSVHKALVGLCAENRMLATPASVNASDTSSGQEDFQSFTGLAADKLHRLLDNVETALAGELLAVRQATVLAERRLPPALSVLVDRVTASIEFVDADRSLSADIETAKRVIREG